MWKMKACTRCGGDVYVSQDEYGWYEQCLQCGYRAELESLAESKKHQLSDKK